jgi:phosphopantetheine--protein transferase-like protein
VSWEKRRLSAPCLRAVETLLSRNIERTRNRCTSPAAEPSRAASYLAARWAAKEALHKAFNGASPRPLRFLFPEMELAAGASGAPFFRLHGAARAHCAAQRLHVSVSVAHERSAAVAFVVAQERPVALA